MPAEIVDGNAVAARLRERYAVEVAELKKRGIHPGLAVVLVGDDPASQVYVNMKGRDCEQVGIYSEKVQLSADTTEEDLLATVDRLNADPKIHGMIVQLPIPDQIDADRVLRRIDPRKDADGFHPENIGRVFVGDSGGFPPATPFGVQHLLVESEVDTVGAHAVIVGRSNIVGRPMASLLWQRGPGADATVTVCHSHTRNLPEITRQADILIVAIGRPNFVTGDMIKPGAVVIDVGVNRVDDPTAKKGYRLVGDVEFDTASEVASLITPVPGGVGPMTRAMLLLNTIKAARQWSET